MTNREQTAMRENVSLKYQVALDDPVLNILVAIETAKGEETEWHQTFLEAIKLLQVQAESIQQTTQRCDRLANALNQSDGQFIRLNEQVEQLASICKQWNNAKPAVLSDNDQNLLQSVLQEIKDLRSNRQKPQPNQNPIWSFEAGNLRSLGYLASLSIIACLGLMSGWHMKSAQVYQHYGPAELAYLDRLWQINSDQLLQCQQDSKPDCKIKLR